MLGLAAGVLYSDPKDFLFAVMNDPMSDAKLRVDAAKALMPHLHPRLAPKGSDEKPKVPGADSWGALIGGEPARPN